MDNHLLSHAIALATEAHKGQKDKYGQEYLHHPIRVMNMGRDLKEGRILCRNHRSRAVRHEVIR